MYNLRLMLTKNLVSLYVTLVFFLFRVRVKKKYYET